MTAKSSKFSDFFNARGNQSEGLEDEEQAAEGVPAVQAPKIRARGVKTQGIPSPPLAPSPAESDRPSHQPEPAREISARIAKIETSGTGATSRKNRGGKRTNPDFVQVTAYIHKDTHKAAKKALLDETDPREFSELVQALLDAWLRAST